jgi:hypothetical protein
MVKVRWMMISVLENLEFADSASFVKEINKARLANPNKWITYIGIVNRKNVTFKSFGLYLQIFSVNGRNYGGAHCDKVEQWKRNISSAI